MSGFACFDLAQNKWIPLNQNSDVSCQLWEKKEGLEEQEASPTNVDLLLI